MTDSDDLLDPEELAAEACGHLLAALAELDGITRALRGEPVLSLHDRLNALRFSLPPSPGGEVPLSRGRGARGEGMGSTERGPGGEGPRQRGNTYPRKVE